MDNTEANIAAARRYLAAIEAGATGDALAQYFTDDVVFEGMPNRLTPAVTRRDLAGILNAAERGQQIIAHQTYVVRSAMAGGERVALEVEWTGTLKVPLGTLPAGGRPQVVPAAAAPSRPDGMQQTESLLPAGGVMRAHFAMFLDFRAGKIAVQRNYDCFEPF